MIRTKNLHIGYAKELLAVDDLSLDKGELYFLIGRNGSGKSTFLKTLIGEIPPLNGEVLLNGNHISHLTYKEIPKTVAFVTTHFPLTDYLTAEEYVRLARTPYTGHFGRISSKDQDLIDQAFDILNIQDLKQRFTSELSDGEKQMVSIAKAIAQETAIIILDEPTAFLDYTNKQRVVDLLKNISKTMEKCIVMSSHDIDMSIAAECPFLAVNSIEKKITQVLSPTSKEEIINLAFKE